MPSCRKSDEAREANERMPLVAEDVYPVVNLDGEFSRYYPATISNQLQLDGESIAQEITSFSMSLTPALFFAGEALNTILASYGLARSSCWYKCQFRLSVHLGTYPRVSFRIKAGQLDQALCPHCVYRESLLDLQKNHTVADQNNRDVPLESEALTAAMVHKNVAPLTSRLAVDDSDGENVRKQKNSLSTASASNLKLRLDARRVVCRMMRGE